MITVDHGRGNTAKDWTDHGEKVPEAQSYGQPSSVRCPLRGEWKKQDIYQHQSPHAVPLLKVDYSENPAPASRLSDFGR